MGIFLCSLLLPVSTPTHTSMLIIVYLNPLIHITLLILFSTLPFQIFSISISISITKYESMIGSLRNEIVQLQSDRNCLERTVNASGTTAVEETEAKG